VERNTTGKDKSNIEAAHEKAVHCILYSTSECNKRVISESCQDSLGPPLTQTLLGCNAWLELKRGGHASGYQQLSCFQEIYTMSQILR